MKRITVFLLILIFSVSISGCSHKETRVETWISAYNKILDGAMKNVTSVDDTYTNNYVIYDVDKNGTPELFVKRGRSEAEYIYKVYTYSEADKKAELIDEVNAGHVRAVFGSNGDDNRFYGTGTHMGYLVITEYTWTDGQINSEIVFNDKEDNYNVELDIDYNRNAFSLETYALNDRTALVEYTEKIAEVPNNCLQNISEINCPDEATKTFKNFILNDIGDILENNSELLYMLDAFDTGVYDISSLKDAYIVDVDNDDEDELILIFQTDDAGGTSSMVIENTYDGMKIRTDIRLYAEGGGTLGRWYSKLLKDSKGKIYLLEYTYGHSYDNKLQKSGFSYKLSTFNSKEQNIVFDKYFYQETDENDESRNSYEVDFEKVALQQYESEFDKMKEQLDKLEVCIDFEKMNGYDSQDKELSYGKDFLKWKI